MLFRNAHEARYSEETLKYIEKCIDSFATTSTFKTYYSIVRRYIVWCAKAGVAPTSISTSALTEYVRGRLEANVSV